MKLSKEATKALFDAMDSAGIEHRSYSGRVMYGKKCLGIEFDSSAVKVVLDIVDSLHYDRQYPVNFYEVIEALKDCREDSMGLGGIVYWPNIEYIEDNHNSDMESDDEE